MSELVSISSANHLAIMLVCIAMVVMVWSGYFLSALVSKRSGLAKPLYIPYTLYTVCISLWILSNAYFQSFLLTDYGPSMSVNMALFANIASGMSFSFAYLFSCRLVSEKEDHQLPKWQWGLFGVSSLITLFTNTGSGLSVNGVDITGIGQFVIHFGPTSALFFSSLLLLLVLTLRNFVVSSKSPSMLKRVKSAYMVFGMLAFILSTFAAHFAIPLLFNDFSVAWVPPALSIIEAVMVGYALLSDRFYSLRYLLLTSLSYSFNAALYLVPVMFFTYFFPTEDSAVPLASLIVLAGLFWYRTLSVIKGLFNRLIYREKGNPVENIEKLIGDFRYSTELAIGNLNQLLNAKSGYLIKVENNVDCAVYLPYFQGSRTVIVREEIEYKIKHENPADKDALTHIVSEMQRNGASLILPIRDENAEITYLYLVCKEGKKTLLTSEEILGLQKLFSFANRFIVTEEKIRTSKALAGSIAHEIRNPLSKINYHFERINADMFGVEEGQYHSIASPEMQNIYRELVEGKKAVLLGNRFIDAILDELSGDGISKTLFKNHSALELTSQALNDFSFNSDDERHRIVFERQEDFVFHGSDTLYSFVIFNLLKNGVHYFNAYPKSKIFIRFCSSLEGNQVRVIDTGPGIPLEQQAHIFKDYYSEGKPTGSGLGLAYCRRVMESFGGSINVRSAHGVFTEFILTFPVVDESYQRSTLLEQLSKRMDGKSCLVLSDKNTYALLASEFEILGVNTTLFSDGLPTPDELIDLTFDFVLLDADQLQREGETIKQLRSGEYGHHAQTTPLWLHIKPTEDWSLIGTLEAGNQIQGKIDNVSDRLSFLKSLDVTLSEGGLNRLGCLIGKKVLVVDDMQVNRLLVQGYLAKEGVTVIHASTGAEAIAKAKSEYLDLILMDINMPGMNGIEATQNIRRIMGDVPVIALTGEHCDTTLFSIEETMDDHLVKPITKQQLVKMLMKWLITIPRARATRETATNG